MFFILLMAFIALISWLPRLIAGRPVAWRDPLRHGMGGAFLFTGIDHFMSLEARYLPMIPPYLSAWDVQLVMLSGLLEIAGAVGLLMPRAGWRRLHLPDLRPAAGIGLAMLLSVMVIANAHVAEAQSSVAGLSMGGGYEALRPLLQPFILLWALVCSEAVYPPAREQRAAVSALRC
jgi:uncharacterized membrane protein